MELFSAGFFRELEGGDPSDPSLESSMDKVPSELRPDAARYLRGGFLLLAHGGMGVEDWLDDSHLIAPLDVRTDGVWLWPGAYAYNVERYGVEIPQDFLDHMARQGWIAPDMSEAEVVELEEQFFKQFSGPQP